MKKYLNYFFILAALLVAGVAIVSCEKEEDEQQGKYTMTVYATKSVNNSSKALSLDGSGLHATWATNDVVKVYKGSNEVGELKAASSGTSTKLSGSITGSITAGDALKLKFLSPNYNSQNGTLAYIAANCDYAEADVTVASISGENIRIEGASAEFVNKQSIVKFILKNSDGSAVLDNPEYLQVSNSSGEGTVLLSDIPASTYTTNGNSVLFVAIPGFENKNVTVDAYLNGSRYSFTKNNISFTDGKYYEIMVKMTYSNLVDLSKVKNNVTLPNGTTAIGTLANNVKISIADGATVTLSGVNINGSGTWSSGDYAGLNCLGDATIILADGTTNAVKGFNQNYPGIQAAKRSGEGEEYTLTIQGTGTLNASSNGQAAGIGGGFNISCGDITINSGTITAYGGSFAAGIGNGGVNSSGSPTCGDITINGGTVTAYGGRHAAGIGNGGIYTGGSPTCGDITINGGEVTATGGSGNNGGAGIGNGNSNGSCGNITISGGTVEVTGGNGGAGIGGGGYRGNCGAITISGGTVTATGGGNVGGAAGIGGGYMSSCSDITINGGTVTAVAGNGNYTGVGIGSGYSSSSNCGNILISGGTVDATGGNHRAGIGAGYYSTCGTITIQNTVTRVTATKGADAVNSIGISSSGRGSCGTVTIGGVVGAISTSPYTYEPLPEGALSGKFTINGSGDQVYFSQGNLKYSAGTWSFHTHQYDMCFTSTGDVSGNYDASGTFDLFGYGTSGYNDKYPYMTGRYDDYYEDHIAGTEYDWGSNAISNGGNTANSGWRTLTQSEWSYLLNSRSTTSGVRYAKATVNGVAGLIILPDDWSTGYYNLSSVANSANSSFNETNITLSEWSSALEAHGAVFLPVFGFRDEATINNAGGFLSYYWSSTYQGYDSGPNAYCAYYLTLGEYYDDYYQSGVNYVATNTYGPVFAGAFVRLVKDAN